MSTFSASSSGHDRGESQATVVSPSTSSASEFKNVNGASVPPIIPPDRPGRTLVLCFDGTGDQFDQDNSNIVEFFSLLKKDDSDKQLVYYQAGIGTYTSPQIATPFWSALSKTIDEMIAWDLDAHVMGGYEFLMQNYTTGDRICIFGFSRGAYTARSLAGMIHKVGIIPKCNHQQVPFAYSMYTRADEVGWQQSNAFKKAFSIDANIEFVGVWDTVSSVGLIPKTLPFATSNTIVRTFRHAVSLDERRAKFKANLWNRPNSHEAKLSISDQKPKKPHPDHCHSKARHLEREYSKDSTIETDVEEVWFSGCHCDVGGGSVSNDIKHNLARIPLRWMIRECFKTNTGIMFDSEKLRDIGLDPATLWPKALPRPPHLPVPKDARIANIPPSISPTKAAIEIESKPQLTEEEHELNDALTPVYDQLSLRWFWWVLEFWPIKQRYQKGDNSWVTYLGFNMGRPRFIPKQKARGVKVHRSVKMRMEALHEDGSKYAPRAAFDPEYTTWVD